MRSLFLTSLAVALCGGCISIRTEHKVEPIHMTVDVFLRLDQELESVFGDLDRASKTLDLETENPS